MSEWMYPGLLSKPNFNLGVNQPVTDTRRGGFGIGGRGGGSSTFFEGMGARRDKRQDFIRYLMEQRQAQPSPVPPEPTLEGRQTGGPISQGQPYVVGEAGPEVVVPGAPGTVVPNPTTPPPPDYSIPQPGQPSPYEESLQTPPTPTVDVRRPFGGFGARRRKGNGTRPDWASLVSGYQEQKAQEQEQFGAENPETPTDYASGQPIPGSNLGGLAMGHAESFLTDPGQVSTIQYERAQEQANQGLRTNTQAAMGQLTGMGIDPRSGFGQLMLQSVTREAGRARGEAARQLAEQEESLRRADIQTGMTAYQNFLNQVFGIIGTQAGTVGGAGAYPSTPAINPYENLSQAISMGGSLLGDYYANRQQKQPAPQPVT
jgi:hypothetical protein